jgi:hypothetical protein
VFLRLLFGLVMGLLMYRPRDLNLTPPPGPGPTEPPPGVDPGDFNPIPVDPPVDPPSEPPSGDGPYPDVPPTAPPGYEGTWPPGGTTPDSPPTGPPGFDGTWPPKSDGTFSLRERIADVLRQLRALTISDPRLTASPDARDGANRVVDA